MAEGGQPSGSQQIVYNDRRVSNYGHIGVLSTGDNNTGALTTSSAGQLVPTQEDIAAELEQWSEGMVETAFYHQLLKTILRGERWVTVKGSPGEGKTTCVKMALRNVQKTGRHVFIVRDPGEFQHIVRSQTNPIIMLDDILGDIEFNISEWKRWKGVFHQQLDLKEHRSNEEEDIQSAANGPTVILISRDNVLKGAADEMGRLYPVITEESIVINMSHSVERDTDEKRKILEAIVLTHIKLTVSEIDDILHTDGGHGFPHVCRIFVTMRRSSPSLSPQDFFRKPLTFLNETMKRFIKDKTKLSLFKEMLKRSGKMSELEVEQFDTEVKQQAMDLLGSYLKIESGYYIFDHPSIYDSVSFTLGSLHTVFVIENCSMLFIYERIRLQSATNPGHTKRSDNDLVVYISDVYKECLAQRFAREIRERELWYVLSHPACTQKDFVSLMMTHVDIPLKSLFQLTDKELVEEYIDENETDTFIVSNFLTLLALNKSGEIFRYIESRPDIQLSKEDIKYVMLGVCIHGAIDILNYLIESGYKLDVDARYTTYHNTLLMVAVNGRSEIVDKLLSLGCDVSAGNSSGATALHIACMEGCVESVQRLLEEGLEVSTGRKTGYVETESEDRRLQSPIGHACYYKRIGVFELLLSREARVTEEEEELAREGSNADIQKLNLKVLHAFGVLLANM